MSLFHKVSLDMFCVADRELRISNREMERLPAVGRWVG